MSSQKDHKLFRVAYNLCRKKWLKISNEKIEGSTLCVSKEKKFGRIGWRFLFPIAVVGHRRTRTIWQHDARLLQGGRRRLRRVRRDADGNVCGRGKVEKRSGHKSSFAGRETHSLCFGRPNNMTTLSAEKFSNREPIL